MESFAEISKIIRTRYGTEGPIPLHAPVFTGNEKKYVCDAIDSTFVSSVGAFVGKVEEFLADYCGSARAIACSNGTSALHISLILAGVERDDEVISQPLTFIATANAINYIGAHSVYVDVDKDTAGMSPYSLERFLKQNCELNSKGQCINKNSGKIIKACVPMHTFGLMCRIEEIEVLCKKWNINLVEDAAEAIGSYSGEKHAGTFGQTGTLSFNGNKIVTAGGGGAIITNEIVLAEEAKYLTTTAKKPHPWEFFHDKTGYNYRMPNLNAALLYAQFENLPSFLDNKQKTAEYYRQSFDKLGVNYLKALHGTTSNYWLNAIVLDNLEQRESFLAYANSNGIMARPCWKLMYKLPMFENGECFETDNAQWLEDRIVNIPSSVI